jgi:K+-sensing histidine kinase KdpD
MTAYLNDNVREELNKKIMEANQETFKYINKYLEIQQKWDFVNTLIHKISSTKDKKQLCEETANGFFHLTNSILTVCCFFDTDYEKVETKEICIDNNIPNRNDLQIKMTKIEQKITYLQKKSNSMQEIKSYFKSLNGNQVIALPMFYNETLVGYFFVINKNENFYDENINFFNIFPEHIALNAAKLDYFTKNEKTNQQKIEFLAGISHEFKTPLNAIIGFSEILKAKISNSNDLKYIENISIGSKHLLSLIEDILDISRSQVCKIEINKTIFSSKKIILEMLNILDQLIQEKDIKLEYTLADVDLYADEKRFRQLVINLVSNAIKFNNKFGKITIFTYINDNNFIFEISDTGEGIRKKDSNKIFEFFSQVSKNQIKRQLGSGIGLALCKIIVEAHNGNINFTSKYKLGTTFKFNLPLKQI